MSRLRIRAFPPGALRTAALAGALSLVTSPVGATFSIIAVDTETRAAGAAVASCIGEDQSLSEVVRVDPMVGVVAAQALFHAPGRDRLLSELRGGATPAQALEAVIDPKFDPASPNTGPAHRQYAAISLQGEVVAFTGSDTLPFADDQVGSIGELVYSVQGNILTGEDVLTGLEDGFRESDGSLEHRLLAAMERAMGAGGDSRCAPHSADAAYYTFHEPGRDPLNVEVVGKEGDATAQLVEEVSEELPSAEPDELPSAEPDEAAQSGGCQWVPLNKGSGWAWLSALLFFAHLRRRAYGWPSTRN